MASVRGEAVSLKHVHLFGEHNYLAIECAVPRF